jgi:hypothetical protein
MVALYYNDKLDQYFSIPYGGDAEDAITPVSLKEDDSYQLDEAKKLNSSQLRVKMVAAKQRKAAEREDWKQAKTENPDKVHTHDWSRRQIRKMYGFEEHFNPTHGTSTEEQELKEEHRIGDEVHYGSPATGTFKRGVIVKVGDDHVVVKRGKYPYKVKKTSIVKSSQTPPKELNEISTELSTRAYHARQKRGREALKQKDYKGATSHFRKAMRTVDLRAKKYKKEHMGGLVRESDLQERSINEDVISHLQKVKAFQTSAPLKHKDGSQTKVDPTTASMLLKVHGALHPDNQKKFTDHLEHSKPKFSKMLDFGWRNIK